MAPLADYQEQTLTCNRRYLDALAVVDDPAPAYPELRRLAEPKVVDGRFLDGSAVKGLVAEGIGAFFLMWAIMGVAPPLRVRHSHQERCHWIPSRDAA